MSLREKAMLKQLSSIPKKMVDIHGADNATEFVLHELCAPGCFDLVKAAFFVNNPDFHCLKGVAGFSQKEEYKNGASHWQSPEHFTDHMKQCAFNSRVRSMQRNAMTNSQADRQHVYESIATDLDIHNPQVLVWDMKYANQGVLVYEPNGSFDDVARQHLPISVYYLAFCPIF